MSDTHLTITFGQDGRKHQEVNTAQISRIRACFHKPLRNMHIVEKYELRAVSSTYRNTTGKSTGSGTMVCACSMWITIAFQ